VRVRHIPEEGKYDQVIQTLELGSGSLTTVLANPALRDILWLPDSRLIFTAIEPDNKSDNLWEVGIDLSSGNPKGKPGRLTNWVGTFPTDLSVTSNGKNLVFLKAFGIASIYVGDFDRNTLTLGTPRRLSFTESYDSPMEPSWGKVPTQTCGC
jgi:hypothetical protein